MLAFFVGVAVFVICAVISSERKYLIPPKDKKPIEDKKENKITEIKETPVINAKSPEFKNSVGLNILLYVGCFLVIAALMGYVSTVDRDLVPPIVLSVTLMALIASILIFKFVKFLKPSSYAFNVSSLIMFLFWIPSLEALGLDWGYAALASFLFLTGAGVISAAIFKHKALWYVPALSLIGLLICCFGTIDDELELSKRLLIYGPVISFMTLGITLRYFWKSKVTWLPVQTRHVTRTFSFIYPIFSGFFALFACDSLEDFPFILTIFTLLLSFYFALEHLLTRNKSIINILRVCLEAVCIALAIDISYGLAYSESSDFQRNLILLTILISSFIQGFISIILFATKHDEESHSRERYVFAASIVGLAVCSTIGSIYASSTSGLSATDTLSIITTLCAQLSIVVFTLIALFLDRNALLLIVTAIGISDVALSNLNDSPLIACIILSAAAIIFSISYSAMRKLDEKHAFGASIVSAIVCAFFALVLGMEESIEYIPILGIGLCMAIQGFLLSKAGLRISGVYIATLGIVSAWASIRNDFIITSHDRFFLPTHSYPTWVYVLDAVICLVPPLAAFLLSAFDKKKPKTLKDSTETISCSPNFIIGGVLAIFNAIVVYPELSSSLSFLNFTLALALLLGLLIWSTARKWLGFEIASLIAILILVLENVGDNVWVTLIIAGLAIIGIVVFASYKNYKKFDSRQARMQNTLKEPVAEDAKSEPKSEKKEETETKTKTKAEDKSTD